MGAGAAALGRAALAVALVLLYYGFSIGITFYNKWLVKVRDGGGGRGGGGGRSSSGGDGSCRSRRASRSRCSPPCSTSCSSSRSRRWPVPWRAAAPGGRGRRSPGPTASAGRPLQVRPGAAGRGGAEGARAASAAAASPRAGGSAGRRCPGVGAKPRGAAAAAPPGHCCWRPVRFLNGASGVDFPRDLLGLLSQEKRVRTQAGHSEHIFLKEQLARANIQ